MAGEGGRLAEVGSSARQCGDLHSRKGTQALAGVRRSSAIRGSDIWKEQEGPKQIPTSETGQDGMGLSLEWPQGTAHESQMPKICVNRHPSYWVFRAMCATAVVRAGWNEAVHTYEREPLATAGADTEAQGSHLLSCPEHSLEHMTVLGAVLGISRRRTSEHGQNLPVSTRGCS